MPDIFHSIVVTGGGGMLAKALLRSIALRGLSAVALDRLSCDVTSEADVRRLFRERRPTLVINCAAHTKVDQCEKEPQLAEAINGYAVGLLAETAGRHNTALVHYSTDFVFDGTSARPYRPEDPTNPLSAYGRSKLLGERKLQENAPPRWLVLRTAWLYGPGGPCFPQTILNAARAGKPLKVVGDQTGCPTFTHDLAEATLDLLERNAKSGVWHLTNAGSTSWFGFTDAILQEFGLASTTKLSATTAAEWKQLRPDSATRPAYSVLSPRAWEAAGLPAMPEWRDALREAFRLYGSSFRP